MREATKKGCLSRVFGLVKLASLVLVCLVCLVAFLVSRNPPPHHPSSPAASGDAPVPRSAAPKDDTPTIGEDGVLEIPGGRSVFLARGDGDWDDLIEAETFAARGGEGNTGPLVRMIVAGRVTAHPNGTPVRVRKGGFASLFVEVVSGEDAGCYGWVQREFVRRPGPAPASESPADLPAAKPQPKVVATPKSIDPSLRAATLLRMGRNLEADGKPKPALENYRRVVEEFGETPSAEAAGEKIKALTGKK